MILNGILCAALVMLIGLSNVTGLDEKKSGGCVATAETNTDEWNKLPVEDHVEILNETVTGALGAMDDSAYSLVKDGDGKAKTSQLYKAVSNDTNVQRYCVRYELVKEGCTEDKCLAKRCDGLLIKKTDEKAGTLTKTSEYYCVQHRANGNGAELAEE